MSWRSKMFELFSSLTIQFPLQIIAVGPHQLSHAFLSILRSKPLRFLLGVSMSLNESHYILGMSWHVSRYWNDKRHLSAWWRSAQGPWDCFKDLQSCRLAELRSLHVASLWFRAIFLHFLSLSSLQLLVFPEVLACLLETPPVPPAPAAWKHGDVLWREHFRSTVNPVLMGIFSAVKHTNQNTYRHSCCRFKLGSGLSFELRCYGLRSLTESFRIFAHFSNMTKNID